MQFLSQMSSFGIHGSIKIEFFLLGKLVGAKC